MLVQLYTIANHFANIPGWPFAAGQPVRKTYFRRGVLSSNRFSHCQCMCQKKKKKENALVQEHSIYLNGQSKREKRKRKRKRAGITGIFSPYPKNTFTNKCDMVLSDKRSRASIVKVVKNPVEAIQRFSSDILHQSRATLLSHTYQHTILPPLGKT